MNVGQLKKELEKYPDNMDVLIEKVDDQFEFTLLNEAEVREVYFSEGKKSPVSATCECLVLSDDF